MPAPIRLPGATSRSATSQLISRFQRIRGYSDLSKLVWFSLPLTPSLPLRIRPFFLLTTFLTLVLLSLLGFHPTLANRLAPPSVPFSDKVLHSVCFGIATMGFYRIWKVNDEARKAWVGWRLWNELITFGVCCIIGGIFSEFVQSLLPYKTFQFGDVFANLLGSGLALWWSWKRAREDRREKELRRLYTRMDHLDEEEENSDLEEEDEAQEPLNSSGRGTGGAREREMEEGRGGTTSSSSATTRNQKRQQDNPWDDGDEILEEEDGREIFGLGGDDDEDDFHQSQTLRRK
ncbi:uncharacterized protein JCM6883_006260 [Sporobolomyces salmoneus]|uniref:uncharacterized protein n=1 Tax=Sporobolomyces salmoneus TaxID=183962 RepID=UPI00317B0361